MPSVDEYRVGMFDMSRIVSSWLAGFPARVEAIERELGQIRSVKEARKQFEIVTGAKANCDRNNGKTVNNLIMAASKLNDMLMALENDVRYERDAIDTRWHQPGCPAESYMGECECDY